MNKVSPTLLTIFIVLVCLVIALLFDETKVTYKDGTTENMLFIEAIQLIKEV